MTSAARATRTPATKPEPAPRAFERVVGDAGSFTAQFWGKRPLLRRSGGSFTDVLSVGDVDALIASSPRRPTVRMVHGGRRVEAGDYCSPARLGGRQVDDTVDARKVAALLGSGATLVLQSLQRIWPPASRFADEFAASASHAVQLNAYLTPPAATGLAEHADDHDVFALQVAGVKHWWVSGLGDVTVEPGGVLYVPARCRHSAATSEALSLHLTLGVLRTTYRSVVERMLRRVAIAELDAPLPLGFHCAADDALTTGVKLAFENAAAALHDADVDEVIAREGDRAAMSYDRVGTVVAALVADEIDENTVISWSTTRPRFQSVDDTHSRVVMGDVTWQVPYVVIPAITELARARSGRAVSQLTGLDAPSRRILARRLLRAGICRVLVDP